MNAAKVAVGSPPAARTAASVKDESVGEHVCVARLDEHPVLPVGHEVRDASRAAADSGVVAL